MSNIILDRQLNKEEYLFVAKYFREIESYEDMFSVIYKLLSMKQIQSYIEITFLNECCMSYIHKNREKIMKLVQLEKEEIKNNQSHSGFIKEVILQAEDEFRRKLEDLNTEIDRSLLKSNLSDQIRILVLLISAEILNALCYIDKEANNSNLSKCVSECFKIANRVLKPYDKDYMKSILAIANYYYDIMEDSEIAFSYLDECYKEIILNSGNTEDVRESLKRNNDLLLLIKYNLTIYKAYPREPRNED